jgi:hypothetical protein
VRAVVVCRPPVANDSWRLTTVGGDASAPLAEIDVVAPEDVPADAPDASLLRDISLGKDVRLRLPLFGHRGADSTQLCEREVAPLLRRLLAGESAAVIAYGQTGAVRCGAASSARMAHAPGYRGWQLAAPLLFVACFGMDNRQA